MPAASMRALLSKWVADGIEDMKKNYDIVGCFRRCGYANCSNGCENFYIKVAGCKDYEPPRLGDPEIVPPPRKKKKRQRSRRVPKVRRKRRQRRAKVKPKVRRRRVKAKRKSGKENEIKVLKKKRKLRK